MLDQKQTLSNTWSSKKCWINTIQHERPNGPTILDLATLERCTQLCSIVWPGLKDVRLTADFKQIALTPQAYFNKMPPPPPPPRRLRLKTKMADAFAVGSYYVWTGNFALGRDNTIKFFGLALGNVGVLALQPDVGFVSFSSLCECKLSWLILQHKPFCKMERTY